MPDPSAPPLQLDAESIGADYRRVIETTLARSEMEPPQPYPYRALALTLRRRLVQRWNETRRERHETFPRRTHYLSFEYLLGRALRNAALNLGVTDETTKAMEAIGLDLEEIAEEERDPGLGNGGLGRLAACYLDSCATLGLPVIGYGLRYRYGLFRQTIRDGYQVEEPDIWLAEPYPWEVKRSDLSQVVHFGGRTERRVDHTGRTRVEWVDTKEIVAEPFDIPIPGYKNAVVNTLRLWSATATQEFDLGEFNAGSFPSAVSSRQKAETITAVLYPNDSNERGVELRLRQQYFLAAASLADTFRRWHKEGSGELDDFAEKHCFQLNDTHPAVAIPELMRILLDEYGLGWEQAWEITSSTMAYTNHTLLPEALETWSVELFERLLPRPLEIIYEINARFLSEVAQRWPGDVDRQARMSLIAEGPTRRLRMAHLAVVGSYSVNGVAKLHSDLLRRDVLHDFYELWPDKFSNKTNGVTPRRWLAGCNPGLADLITEGIGEGWVTDLDELEQLAPLADDAAFREQWAVVKRANKERLARLVLDRTGIRIDTSSLFDVQVKRIHEYKRQLMNVLHAIHLYRRIRSGHHEDVQPRTILLGGVAAPSYAAAKKIVKLANNVAAVINADPAVAGRLRVVFIPGYNVSAMEVICPAADLSSQISTAGKEASGTGNMKFMMNGAVTIGTYDGANIEIREAVGPENFFVFGLNATDATALRENYDPQSILDGEPELAATLELLRSGHFNQFESGVFDDVMAGLLSPSEPWLTLADLSSFATAQREAAAAYAEPERWLRMSIANTAASGRFSSDRAIGEYNDEIWGLTPQGAAVSA